MKEDEYLDITVIPHEGLSDEQLNDLVDHIVQWFEDRDLHTFLSAMPVKGEEEMESVFLLLNEFKRFAEQVRVDTEAIERDILSSQGPKQVFAEWTTVANTYRWAEELMKRVQGHDGKR